MNITNKRFLKAAMFGVYTIVVALVSCGIVLYMSGKQTDKGYLTTTKPLYVNNEIYISELPLIEKAGEIYIPLQIFTESDTISEAEAFDEEGIMVIDETPYASLQYIESKLDWRVINNDTEIYVDNFKDNFDYSWTENEYIAHAFGAIGDDTYTNSLEAFLTNYEAGHRVFEIDLSLTSDNELVVLHDWSENTVINVCGFDIPEEKIGLPLTKDEFLSMKVNGKYTTLDFEAVLKLLQEYPDVYFVTDTKETQDPYISQQFQHMKDAAAKIDITLLDRLIPQIYNEAMYDIIMNIYDWKSIIYTLYNQGRDFSAESVVDFSYRNGIKVITTYESRAHDIFLNELLERERIIYMHTFNDEVMVEYWKNKGVYGIYTDFLKPKAK